MKHLFIILLICLPVLGFSKGRKRTEIDSMVELVSTSKDDTFKVKLLGRISDYYRTICPDTGIIFGNQELKLAEDLGWEMGIALAYEHIGINYRYEADYTNALENDFKALKLFEKINSKYRRALTLDDIGSVYYYLDSNEKALFFYFQSLKLELELNDKRGIAERYGNIGVIYSNENDFLKALQYDSLAMKMNIETGDSNSLAVQLGNLGAVYINIKNYPIALQCLLESNSIFEKNDDRYGFAINIGNIGELYYTMATDTSKPLMANLHWGNRKNLFDSAIKYLSAAIESSKINNDMLSIIEFSKYLADTYKKTGECSRAFDSYVMYITTKDSVFSNQNQVKITKLQIKRDLDLKDKEILIDKLAVQQKKNERLYYVSGMIILLVVTGFVVRNNLNQKLVNKLLSKEKKKSDDLLLNILPAEVAEELKTNGTTSARHFDPVTVLFTDFVNFTTATERMSPQELIDELHECFKAFDDIASKYHIEKIKTIGDAYMAVAGLPKPEPEHAQNMVKVAIEIRNFMQDRYKKLGDKTFEIRIGIHSGSVVAGIVGVKKFAYDIWGDTVNTAARMEQNSAAGKINISETTYELLKDKFTCEYRGEIEAKNKGAMKMYFVN